MKTARDLMTSPAECLAPDETLVDAARMFSKYDVGSMPVVDGDTLVGVITDRDIVVEGVAKNLDLPNTQISKIMSRNVVTVQVTDDAHPWPTAVSASGLEADSTHNPPECPRSGRFVGSASPQWAR